MVIKYVILKYRLCLLLFVIVIMSCRQSGSDSSLTSVKVGMMFIPHVQFAPFYVAQDLNYYREAGLTVHFDYSSQADAIQLLGLKKFDFVVGDGEQVIIARDRGLPIKSVMTLYARYPLGIAALISSGIELPSDLKSKTVGVPDYYGASYMGLKTFLHRVGLTEQDLLIVPIGYTQAAALTQGRVDAAVVYLNNTPVQLRRTGQALRLIPFYQYVSLVSACVLTHDDMTGQQADISRRFVNATWKGIRFVQKHPDEALDICLKYLPNGEANHALQDAVLKETIPLFQNDSLEVGRHNPLAWQSSLDMLLSLGIVKKQVAIDSCFTDRFVPLTTP